MNNTNTLISGDNKGYASYLMEKDMNNGALPGQVASKYIMVMQTLRLTLVNVAILLYSNRATSLPLSLSISHEH